MKKKNSRKSYLFSEHLQKLDLFGSGMSFRENGNQSLKTNCGALLSIVILIVVLIYGANKFRILIGREDSTNTEYMVSDSISDKVIGFEDTGFFPAFAILERRN